jgi:putative YhdH/YhfP family quinone oxidoreductase
LPAARYNIGMSIPDTFRCYLVEKDASGQVAGRIARCRREQLPEGQVLIRVVYSSLNYKDALAATGHPGVNKVFPHVPGVDAAGVVAHSGGFEFVEGDEVLCTGFDMGANRWGGWAEYVCVPQEWVVPLPGGLTLREAIILGTAGLTAGMCVDALEHHGVTPDRGDVVVSGASGGVGSMAVAILAKLGYRVSAVSGKPGAHDFLHRLGAREVLGRESVDEPASRPLLSARWAGGVDTVGGNPLSTIIRAAKHSACVVTCGTVAGTQFDITVYPFILRAVTLTGVDAAWCTHELRHNTWRRLAGPWKPDHLEAMAQFRPLEQVPAEIERILAGQVTGRVVIEIGDA